MTLDADQTTNAHQASNEHEPLKDSKDKEHSVAGLPFINGMDISFLDEIESEGGIYYDEQGTVTDLLQLLRDSGVNAIRLRIWNEPAGGYCNLARTLPLARRIKALGFHFLLDFHYSDKWADPAHQHKPAAWEQLGFEELKAAVHGYTREVLTALREQGTPPDMVQIGNEITPGMLWDDGKVDGEFDTDAQWEKLAALVQAGIAGARETLPEVQIMIHIDRGGDVKTSKRFFAQFDRLGVEFDCIGLSYYPWWHGNLDDLQATLHGLAAIYDKPINVVETAYPWTIEPREGQDFIVTGETELLPDYEASIEGQSRYLRDFLAVIQSTPSARGAGFYWWEPAWIPSKPTWSVGHSNNWSNLTLFDFTGRKLPTLDVLQAFSR